ncbi:12754_t:CDS:2 [Entrophospora sp. SA101]|nr:12754_t:CDS:2 [Entrophospora sp. SA101]
MPKDYYVVRDKPNVRRNCKSSNKTDSITLDEDKSEHLEIDFSIINYNEVSYSNYITGGGNRKINPEVQTENNQEEDTEDNQETTEGEYEEGDTDSNSTISNQPEDNNPRWDQDSNSEILVVKATSNSE